MRNPVFYAIYMATRPRARAFSLMLYLLLIMCTKSLDLGVHVYTLTVKYHSVTFLALITLHKSEHVHCLREDYSVDIEGEEGLEMAM